jgi:hypothetical protein
MTRTLSFTIVAALLAVSAAAAQDPGATQVRRPAFAALEPDLQELVVTWLGLDCGAQEGTRIEDRLRAVGPRLEEAFLEALRLGRPAEDREADRKAIAERFDRRQEWLRSEGSDLLGQEEVGSLLARSQEEYVGDELRNADVGYRTQAVLALGFVGGDESRRVLEPIAADPDDPAREAARLSLEEIAGRGDGLI